MPVRDPLIGLKLGEYEVLALIGEGGMGLVYRGIQPVIKKQVAIKVLKLQPGGGDVEVERFIGEAEAVNAIRHRSIIDIFSLGRLPDGRPYIVMEFLEGQPLDLYVGNVSVLTVPETVSVLLSLCSPLAAAHRAGVIHRDLKPSNVFICEGSDGERFLKLLDFGLAKGSGLGARTEATSPRVVMGTPDYMAPEQARGDTVTYSIDVYALGVMAFELLAGRLPFKGENPIDTMWEHVSTPVPSLSQFATVPRALEALVTRMLAKEPAGRPASIDEVRKELQQIATEVGTATSGLALEQVITGSRTVDRDLVRLSVEPTLITQPLPPPQRSRVGLITGLAVVVLALGTAVVVVGRPTQPTPTPTPTPKTPTPATLTVPVEVTPDVPPDAGDPDAPEAFDAGRAEPSPEDAGRATPKPSPPSAPTLEVLSRRVARLEAAVLKATPAGEEPDAAAAALLRKYKLEVMMVQTPAERLRFSKTLDDFERSFLRR